jgi:hypothetical protein
MREIHVFFMYFAYEIYNKVAATLAKSEELLDASRNLLVALHLVKGFSSKVYIYIFNYGYNLYSCLNIPVF